MGGEGHRFTGAHPSHVAARGVEADGDRAEGEERGGLQVRIRLSAGVGCWCGCWVGFGIVSAVMA